MRIGFTCGVFDMFHSGHKKLIQKIKQNSNKVVVFVHNDKSTYKNKDKFPVQNVEQRMGNLLSTGLVNEVIEVRSPDPSAYFLSFIKKNEGNILNYYRGDDWFKFPGKEALKGASISYLPYTQGISSSKIRDTL